MNMKKSLLALSTTAVIAVGGAGIAAADEPADDTATTGSITNLPSGDAAGSLESLGGAAKDVSKILKAVNALIKAGGNVEGVVSDTQDFLGATGN